MKRDIEITTADGPARASLFTPSAGTAGGTGVILYMDAFGPRPALDEMAERIAGFGHTVLVPDLFYRNAPYGPFDTKTTFAQPESRNKIMAIMGGTTHDMTASDTKAFLAALDDAGATGKVGAVGYCFGGGRAITAAAVYPDRVVAAASFHGGNLAPETPDSPHLKAASIKGRVYVGAAGVDGSFPPEQSARLENAFRTAGVDFVLENYVGMDHGWTVPDNSSFNEKGAERHWARLETFFGETL